jgi:hypothetical protein
MVKLVVDVCIRDFHSLFRLFHFRLLFIFVCLLFFDITIPSTTSVSMRASYRVCRGVIWSPSTLTKTTDRQLRLPFAVGLLHIPSHHHHHIDGIMYTRVLSSSSSPPPPPSSSSSSCCHKKAEEGGTSTENQNTNNNKNKDDNDNKQGTITMNPWSISFWSDKDVWRRAASNTTRCLIGCSTGDFAMLFYLQSQYPTLSPAYTMPLVRYFIIIVIRSINE